MGRDFGLMTRSWISKTELFVIMNSLTITEKSKNQWIYQWICDIQIIWKLSYINLLRIVLLTLNYVDCILLLHWFFPYGSQWIQIIKMKNMIKPLFWQKGYYKITPDHLCICLPIFLAASLSACLWHTFPVSTQRIFLIFCMKIFCRIYYKVTKPDFRKLCLLLI